MIEFYELYQINFSVYNAQMNSNTSAASFPASPNEALERLIEGNRRFTTGMRSVEPLLSHMKMADLAKNGQKPFAIVLTCSDSRSPAEMIFDQGLGDLFVVRVAGNVVAPSLLASIEFAAANFGSPIIVVLGHSLCGAVNATIQHTKNPTNPLPSPHLEELVGRIRPAVEGTLRECSIDHPELLQRSTSENVKRSIRLIESQSEIVKNLIQSGKLAIRGAVLDIATGNVEMMK
jgi:carbonic anhydrase